MIGHHGNVPSSADELEASLRRAIPEASFDIGRFGTFSPSDLSSIYNQGHPTDLFRIGTARTVLNDSYLMEIGRIMRSMLAKYIEGDCIGNGHALVSGGLLTISMTRLIEGVVRAAAVVGPEPTAHAFGRWANGEPIQYHRCALLDGLTLEHSLSVNGWLRIDVLPSSSTDAFRHLPVGSDLDIAPSSILGKVKVSIACSMEPAFFLPSLRAETAPIRASERSDVLGPIQSNFWDIFCKAFSLAGNRCVGCMAEWTEPVVTEPFGLVIGGGGSSRRLGVHPTFVSQSMSQEELDNALVIFHRLSGDAHPDTRPWLAIDRWMRSKESRAFEDQIIDLRIALEALFGVDGGREIAFRVATRSAWYLGNEPEDRRQIYTSIEAAYREASKFIHADAVRNEQKSRSIFERAQYLCREAILKWLEHPWKPDKGKWDAMIMGQ